MEPANRGGRTEGWPGVMALMELARKPDAAGWSPERRERIYQQIAARAERQRERRRVMRAFAAGASAVVLVGLLVRLVSGGSPWLVCPTPDLAGRAPTEVAFNPR